MLLTPSINMPYTKPSFIFPPRPEHAIPMGMIQTYQDKGWAGTYKMNGTCTTLCFSPEGEIYNFTRHGHPHKTWKPTKNTQLLKPYIKSGSWTVLLVELMDAKTKNIKDTLYIHDILVEDSLQLIGTKFIERQNLLTQMFPNPQDETDGYYIIEKGIWLSKPLIIEDLTMTFKAIKVSNRPEVEGLVLKDPNGKLEPMIFSGKNQSWQVKARVANENGKWGF